MENLSNFLNWNMSISLVIYSPLTFYVYFLSISLLSWNFEHSEQQEPSHGQATDMDMKAFQVFWKIFAIGNFRKTL